MNPLVSVCIPTYNNPEGLRKTLGCITTQTYKNLDIIVSDNCSENPEVPEIITGFCDVDNRIRAYRHQSNIEVDGNYRFVIDNAKGKYFMFAQDDDWWSPGFIERLVDLLENNLHSPAAVGTSCYITSDGSQSEYHFMNNLSVFNTVGNGDLGFVCMGLWRRDMFMKAEVRLPRVVLGGDHITVAHAILAFGNISVSNKTWYAKGYAKGRFEICFRNDFWYSFRTWSHLIKTLLLSPYIPSQKKLLIPAIAITNFGKSCIITGIQVALMLPEQNPIRRTIQKKVFGSN